MLPDGPTFRLAVLIVDGGARVTSDDNGGADTFALPLPHNGQVVQLGNQHGGATLVGGLVFTDDPSATYLELLRTNGLRYRTELTSVGAHPDTRFAALFVPSGEFVSASLLDVSGQVLDTTRFDR